MTCWLNFLIPFVIIFLAFWGNYYLQKRLIAVNNKEKAIDLLISVTKNLEELYTEYWNKEKHDQQISLTIKIIQTRLLGFVEFVYQKYKLENKQTINQSVVKLIKGSTDDEFDSMSRSTSNPDKCVEISKLSNIVILELLRNKI